MVFDGFSWFYSGFELLTTKSMVKTKKNHEFWILRDPLKMVVFLVVLVFYSGFGGLSWFLMVFREFYNRFGGQYLETTVKRKTMNFWFSELV